MRSSSVPGWLAALLVGATACGGAAHPQRAARSRETCERAAAHSFELRYALASLALDDHSYQRRKIEADLAAQRHQLLQSPTFLSSCGELTERELTCMAEADDWFTHESCYSPSAAWAQENERAASRARQAARVAAETAAAPRAPEAPCPPLRDAGGATTSVRGAVRDAKGGPAIGAVISFRQPGSDADYSAIVDEDGRYAVDGIPPGHYHAVIDGYQVARRCAPLRGGSQVLDLERSDAAPPGTEVIELR